MPEAFALGRLLVRTQEDVIMATNETVHDATTITLSRLGALHGSDVTASPSADCLQMMRTFFPESVDRARFDALVPAELYERLGTLHRALNVALRIATLSEPIASVLQDPTLVSDQIGAARPSSASRATARQAAGPASSAPCRGRHREHGRRLRSGAEAGARALQRPHRLLSRAADRATTDDRGGRGQRA